MKSNLRAEIKQQKPFDSLEQEVHLNLERTTAVLSHAFAEALKPFDVTPTQYNVLRILRGAGPAGLCRNDVRDRMVSQVPDVTRLMDRLEESGLIERERSATDRRQVASRITAKGLDVLERARCTGGRDSQGAARTHVRHAAAYARRTARVGAYAGRRATK